MKYLNRINRQRFAAAMTAAAITMPVSLAVLPAPLYANESVLNHSGGGVYQPLPEGGVRVKAVFNADGSASGSAEITADVLIPAKAVYDGSGIWNKITHSSSADLKEDEIRELIADLNPDSVKTEDIVAGDKTIGQKKTETFNANGQTLSRITEAYTSHPDTDIPTGAEADGKGGWSISEKSSQEKGDLNDEHFAVLESELAVKIPAVSREKFTEGDYTVVRTTEVFELAEGRYTRITEELTPVHNIENPEIKPDPEKNSTRTGTWQQKTTGGTKHCSVTPGQARMEIATLSGTGNLKMTEAAALLTNNEKSADHFNAEVTLKLEQPLKDRNVKISILSADGQKRPVESENIQVSDQGDEISFSAAGLSRKQPEEIQLSFNGASEKRAVLEAWTAPFNTGDGAWNLGDADRFSVFTRKYTWAGHTNANVAAEVLDLESNNGICLGIGTEKGASGNYTSTDYSHADLNYIGSFKGNGNISTNNTNSYLIIGDQDMTITQDSDPGKSQYYTFSKDGQKVEKLQGVIKKALKAEGTGIIDFDSAFEKLNSYAVNQLNQTDPKAFAEGSEEQKTVKERLEQIEKAITRSEHGNRDITIDCSKLPVVNGVKYVSLDISDLQGLNSNDQFIYFDNIGKDDRIMVNAAGMKSADEVKSYSISINNRINKMTEAFNPLNDQVKFNFGGYAGEIKITKTFYGSVMAPSASVDTGGGEFNGKLISAKARGHNEQHSIGSDWDQETGSMIGLKLFAEPAKTSIKEENGSREVKLESIARTYYKVNSPEEPDTPDTPEQPEDPDTPDTPEQPEEPDTPEEPEEPDTPDTPEQPEEPDTPEQPEEPDTPEENGKTEESEKTGKPGTKPSSPVKPSASKAPKTSAAEMPGFWAAMSAIGGFGALLFGSKKRKSE